MKKYIITEEELNSIVILISSISKFTHKLSNFVPKLKRQFDLDTFDRIITELKNLPSFED